MTTEQFTLLKAGDYITVTPDSNAMDMTPGKAYKIESTDMKITDASTLGERIIFTDDVGDRRRIGSNWSKYLTKVEPLNPDVDTNAVLKSLIDTASEVIIGGKKYVKKSIWVAV